MWATRLRCPSCPQRCWVLEPWICDKAMACRAADREHRERWSGCPRLLQGRQHAGEDFEPKVVFVAQAVGATLDHPDLVVEPFDEAERDLVLGPAVGRNAVPMTVDHRGELLVRCEPLPLEARPPVLEEAPCPALA